jgi:3-oxoacyl-[acyl-carrier-protein] synthase I
MATFHNRRALEPSGFITIKVPILSSSKAPALFATHYTLTNALGNGNESTWQAIEQGRSGLAPCNFETADIPTYIGQISDALLLPVRDDLKQFDCRNNRLAQLSLQQDGFEQAVKSAIEKYGAHRIGVFLGTSTSGIFSTELAYRERPTHEGKLPPSFNYAGTQNNYSLAGFVSKYFGLKGPALVVSSACSSSAKVFGNAQRMIEAGFCDAAIVGGVDSLCLTTLYGFKALGLVSEQPCRPYDGERNGISISEAAGFALLEKSSDSAKFRISGVGESSDAYHMSSPHPEGRGAAAAMNAALFQGGLQPSGIGYINLHGTATKTNDAAEGAAVASLFGGNTPVSSTKGFHGHSLGAAGITEIAIAAMALERSLIPGSLNTQQLDPSISVNYQLQNCASKMQAVMSNSFGFGGSNCSVLIEAP